MVLGIPQFKKPLFVVRSLATSTGENDPENLHLDQRLGQAPSPMARRAWMPRSLRRQSRPSWGFRSEFSRALHLKPLSIHLVESIRRHVDSRESFGRQTGGHDFSSSSTVLLASIGYRIPSKLQLLKVNLDDSWFS